MIGCYILDGHTPVPSTCDKAWGDMMGHPTARRVALTTVAVEPENITVSTVFLGVDHGQFGKDNPVLFETMVFGGECTETQTRYCTWEEAEAGHALAVATIEAVMQKKKNHKS